MKRLIVALIAGLANFAFGEVEHEFYTGGAASWIQTGDVWRSGAIDSSMTPDEEDWGRITSWLELTVDGPCTVSFDSNLLPIDGNSYRWPSCELWIDGNNISWNLQSSRQNQSVDVCGGGVHVIRWEVYTYDDWEEDARSPIEISNVQIQGAPASVTVRFDANGGSVSVSERTFSTSAENYGDLPVPTRGGCEFLGWFTAKLGGNRVDEESGVRFNASVLYAQWSIPLKQAVGGGASVNVSTDDWGEPWNQWHGVPDESHDGAGAAFGGKNSGPLYIQTSGKGTLSFWWKAKSGGVGYLYDVTNDGWSQVARVASKSTWNQSAQKSEYSDSDWQQAVIPVSYCGESRYQVEASRYSDAGDDCGVLVDEVRWTPAPDSVTVSFDANGGQVSAQPMTFDTYGCYEGLPTPTRDGWDFDGWFTAPVGGWRVENDDGVRFEATVLYAHWSIPLDEALGTDLEIWSGQMENSDDFTWYGNPEIETPVGRGAACIRRNGKASYSVPLHASLGGMGTISFWWKIKGDAYGYFRDTKGVVEAQLNSGDMSFNPETGLIEYLDSEWKQVTFDCRNVDEVFWYGYLYDDVAELYVAGLTWTPAPEAIEVKFMTGKHVVGKKETYAPGDRFWEGGCAYESRYYEPTREGFVFGGWYYDTDFANPVKGSDYVPFAGATVYAKWCRTLASAETPLKFTNNPFAAEDALFYSAMGYISGDWEIVEQTYGSGEEEMAANLGAVSPDGWNTSSYAVLETKVTGSAFLDFVWGMTYGNGFGSLVLTVDGEEVEDLDMDLASMTAGGSSEQTVRVVLGEGEHTVRWEAVGDGGNAKVRDVSTSEITPAATLGEWMTRWRTLCCWTPDNLPGLVAKSAAAKTSGTTAARYKAAVEHALATLLALGEDKLVVDTFKQFGFEIDFLKCRFPGTFNYEKAPVLNDLADAAVEKARVAIEAAVADLELIPSTWTGTVPLSAAEYPVDADIVIDYGDVLYLKSILKAALGAAQWVKAYNVEMDWKRLEADLKGAWVKTVTAEPTLDSDVNWGESTAFTSAKLESTRLTEMAGVGFWPMEADVVEVGGVESSGEFRTAWYGDKLYLRIEKNKFLAAEVSEFHFALGNGSMSAHESTYIECTYFKSGIEMSDPMTGGTKKIYWLCDGDAWSDVMSPADCVEVKEDDSTLLLIIDLSGTSLAKNKSMRYVESVELNTSEMPDELTAGSEIIDGTLSYHVKGARSVLAGVRQTKVCDRVRDVTALKQSKTLVLEALKLAQSADTYITTKRTCSDACLFNYDDRDEALVQAMREHVATAIASMDAAQQVDWQKGLSKKKVDRVGYLESPVDVYLGALFSGRMTSGIIPPSAREDAYVADLGRMSSPTAGGLLPGMSREKWAEIAEAEGVAYRYDEQMVPEYGPWGEADAVKNPDKLGPTMLTDMTLLINGLQAMVGDVVAAFRADTGALCGLGKVMDESGTLSMVCYAPTGVKLHFKVWVAASGVEEPVIADCDARSDLAAPTSGAFLPGHALVVSDDKDLTISLGSADWHTVSFNVLPEDPSPAAVFGSVKAKIAAVTQGIEFWMPGKSSSLKAIEIGKGYWVNTKADNVEWTVSGKTDPKAEIALEEGWNLVGYAPEAEGAVQQVLKTALAAKAVDYVTYGIEFYPGGTLKKMEPGKAYWVHAKKAYTLVYDDGAAGVRALPLRAGALNAAAVPTYGPWGESEAVKNPDKLGPTFLTDLAVEIDGEPAAYGDVVAVFRGDTGALCGLGKVMDDSGTLTVVCYAQKGVTLSFKVWLAESGVEEPVVAKCDNTSKLIAPESGDFYNGHAISGSTAELIETIVPGEKVEIDTGLIGYTASGLPSGLKFDKTTGLITGSASKLTAAEGVVVKFTKKDVEDEELTIVVRAEEISAGCEELSSGPLPAGVAGAVGGMDIQIDSEGGTKSVSVTKLPSGMKYDSKTGKITGAPTKAGEYEVVLTVTTKYGNKKTEKISVSVAAMPVMAVGKFDGFVSVGGDNLGTFTLTTTDAGKLTAKVVTAAGTVSFSGTCWDAVEKGVYRATLTTKKGEKLTLTLDSAAAWDANQLTGSYSPASGRALDVTAQKNAFGKTWYFSAVGNESTGWKLAYIEDTKGAALTVTLKADGAVSIAGTLQGTKDAKGKATTFKVSASGYANVCGLKDGAILADFAPILTVNKVKTVLAITTNLWFDRKNEVGRDVGQAKFAE